MSNVHHLVLSCDWFEGVMTIAVQLGFSANLYLCLPKCFKVRVCNLCSHEAVHELPSGLGAG